MAAPIRQKESQNQSQAAPSPCRIAPDLVTAEGYLKTLPCHFPYQGGMDGFCATRFEKTKK
jgi:hypothetical protein